MKVVPFELLYHMDFMISEPMSKNQNWATRGNVYNALGRPKVSHTFLWFKNCSAVITDKDGTVLNVQKNQLTYMAKGIEYRIDFKDTAVDQADTLVVHFQLTDGEGNEIAPVLKPVICLSNVEPAVGKQLDLLAKECRKNVVCIPEVKAVVYRLMALICQKQKNITADGKFACIRTGITLLEQDSDLSIAEIASRCGVSECYFRRLFREYSGENPMNFRQHHRIERAKQLLLSDEHYTIGEIAQELHFTDIYHFSKTFKQYCGVSPSKYDIFYVDQE